VQTPDSRENHAPVTDEVSDTFRDWYESKVDAVSDSAPTLNFFGAPDGRYKFSSRSRIRRIGEILSIVRTYDITHGLTPLKFRRMLEELGPTFVKAGQILSMRSEILSEPFCQELSKLRADVEPMDRDVVLDTLRSEYDRPLEDIFDAIDDVPLGSASVAQVHKARLVTGELVAIKLQRPGVQEVMAQDIDIMRSLVKHANLVVGDNQVLDLKSVVEELWQSFREETDFLIEARSLDEFRRNNAQCAFVSCPKPYLGLCTEHVVVMDFVEGIPIAQTDRLTRAGYSLEEIGNKLVDNYTQQMLDDGFFHADPHPGNLLISGGKICYLDLGIMGRLSALDRSALTDIVVAVGQKNSARLKDGLLRFAAMDDSSRIDHAHLLEDIDLIIENYGSADLSDLDIPAFVNAIIGLARRNGIELPGSVTMLARSLVTLEGLLDEFLPGVSMIEIVKRHVQAHSNPADMVKSELESLGTESHAALHGLLKTAATSPLALDMLTRGQLRMNLDLPGSTDPIADFSHAFDRLTMGIVIAGLFIGSSVIYYARVEPVIFGIPVVGFLGFTIALVLGIWIIVSIMRDARPRRR
jgi:ubiquinone biosynthesis protein